MPITATSWKPGKSGNPKGRTRLHDDDIPAYARQFGRQAVDTMVACLKDDRWKLPAAIALLDRGFGKPVQHITGDPDQPVAIHFTWAPATPTLTDDTESNSIDGTAEAATVSWGK